jgi:hypothetical protein
MRINPPNRTLGVKAKGAPVGAPVTTLPVRHVLADPNRVTSTHNARHALDVRARDDYRKPPRLVRANEPYAVAKLHPDNIL